MRRAQHTNWLELAGENVFFEPLVYFALAKPNWRLSQFPAAACNPSELPRSIDPMHVAGMHLLNVGRYLPAIGRWHGLTLTSYCMERRPCPTCIQTSLGNFPMWSLVLRSTPTMTINSLDNALKVAQLPISTSNSDVSCQQDVDFIDNAFP